MTINGINKTFNYVGTYDWSNPTISHTLLDSETGYLLVDNFGTASIVATGNSRTIQSEL